VADHQGGWHQGAVDPFNVGCWPEGDLSECPLLRPFLGLKQTRYAQLIALHLLGVLAASFEQRENLVKAMISGRKRAD
jgi:hypothetical protein